MSERRLGRTIVGALLIAVPCALLFLVPSAYLVHKGQSHWLALAAGLAAFPLVPVLWHLLAERRRKRAGGKSTLTGSDRFVMRLVAVGLVAILPLLLFARGQTWRAVKQHPTWFLHWGGDGDGGGGSWSTVGGVPISTDARLLVYVPADAEWVVWIRATEEFKKAMTRQFGQPDNREPDEDQAAEVLLAGRRDGFLAIVRGGKAVDSAEVDKLEDELDEYLFGKKLPLVTHSPAADVHMVMTEGWQPAIRERAEGGGSEPRDLVLMLRGAPADAPLVAAARHADVGGVIIETGTGHMRIADKGLVVEADVQLASATAAAALRAFIDAKRAAGLAKLPDKCREPVGKLDRGIDIGGADSRLEFRLELAFEDLMAAMFCQLGAGGGDGEED